MTMLRMNGAVPQLTLRDCTACIGPSQFLQFTFTFTLIVKRLFANKRMQAFGCPMCNFMTRNVWIKWLGLLLRNRWSRVHRTVCPVYGVPSTDTPWQLYTEQCVPFMVSPGRTHRDSCTQNNVSRLRCPQHGHTVTADTALQFLWLTCLSSWDIN